MGQNLHNWTPGCNNAESVVIDELHAKTGSSAGNEQLLTSSYERFVLLLTVFLLARYGKDHEFKEGLGLSPFFSLQPIPVCVMCTVQYSWRLQSSHVWQKQPVFPMSLTKGPEAAQRPNPKINMLSVWDPMPELTVTSPNVDPNTCTMGIVQPYARVDLNPSTGQLG